MNIQHVPISYVNMVWPKVEGYIAKAVNNQKGQPDYTIDQVKTFVTTGQWMLIVVTDEPENIKGAVIVQFFNRPNDRVAFVTYIGGRLIANPDTFNQLCALCKSFGATKIEGAVSEAVSRLWRKFGFEEKYRIAEVSIL